MQTCRQAQLALRDFCQRQGLGRSAAASAPSDIHKERAQGVRHTRQASIEIGKALLRFRREELEREVGGVGRQGRDLVGDLIHGLGGRARNERWVCCLAEMSWSRRQVAEK